MKTIATPATTKPNRPPFAELFLALEQARYLRDILGDAAEDTRPALIDLAERGLPVKVRDDIGSVVTLPDGYVKHPMSHQFVRLLDIVEYLIDEAFTGHAPLAALARATRDNEELADAIYRIAER